MSKQNGAGQRLALIFLTLPAFVLTTWGAAGPTVPGKDWLASTQSLFVSVPGACVFSQNILRISRTYRQGEDGRIVIEADEPTRFLASQKAFRCEDASCSGGRYIAFLQNGWYEIEVNQPVKLVRWYRGYFPTIGNWNHTEQLDEGTTKCVIDNKTFNLDDPGLNRWVWKKGDLLELSAGKHLFSMDWQGGARLDQMAFLPEGLEPKAGELFAPTYKPVDQPVVAVTDEITIPTGQVPQKLILDAISAGGQVDVQASTDKGRTWQPIPADGSLAGLKTKGGSNLQFKLTLVLASNAASPTICNLAVEIRAPRRPKLTGSIPVKLLLTPAEIELVPATWVGMRPSDKGWMPALLSQPDKDGAIWLDAAGANRMILAPVQESWVVDDKSAASGKAVYQGALNRNLISFDINVVRTTMFRPWFRIKLFRTNIFAEINGPRSAYTPFVSYQFDRQDFILGDFSKKKDFPREAFDAQQWIWLPGPDIALQEGCHTLRIRAGLEYTLLDRVALVPAASNPPTGLGGNSLKAVAASGEVVFHPLDWPVVKKLKKIIAQGATSNANMVYSFSRDSGKSWEALSEDAFGKNPLSGQPLFLKATLSTQGSRAPIIASWQVVLEPAGSQAIVLANAEQKLLFDTETGGFLGWWSKKAGWIIPPGRLQPLFSFSMGPAGSSLNQVYPQPTDFTRLEIKSEQGVTTLILNYRMAGGLVPVSIKVELPGKGLARWHMELINRSTMDIRNLEFLSLSGLRVGADPENIFCVVNTCHTAPDFPGAPFQIPGGPIMYLGSTMGQGGTYPSYSAMGWLSLYNQDGGFTAQVRDKDGILTDINLVPDPVSLGMKFGFTRKIYVGPGEKGEANYEAGWHASDWHRAADIYSVWAHSWMDFSRVNANWARDADGWIGGSGMGSGILPKNYLLKPIPEMDPCFIQHFGNSMDGMWSSSAFPLINPRYGTFKEFKMAHEIARANNCFNTYYWDHRGWSDDFSDAPFIGTTPRTLLPPEVILPPRGFGEKWAVRDLAGKTAIFGYMPNDLSMCPASKGWQDMLVEGITRNYMQFQGADGVYADEALIGIDCYAENHGHGKQHGLYDKGLQEVFRRALDLGRKMNPNMAMIMEGCNDQLMQYVDFGLWVWSSYTDGVPFMYAFPEVKLLRGYNNPGGIWFKSMAEYEHTINLLSRGGFISDRRFYAHRNRIKDWMYQSQFRDVVDLSVSRPGVIAKWFRREDRDHIGALINIQNEFAFGDAAVKIKWPALKEASHAFAYLYDEEEVVKVSLKKEKDGVVVAVPGVKAAGILIPAKFPGEETIRSYLLCPHDAGDDRLILWMVNTSDKKRKVALSYELPAGVTLKSPPTNTTLAAGAIAKLEILLLRTTVMAEQSKMMVKIKDQDKESQASYILSRPSMPLYNGNFEVKDQLGNMTPDGWDNTSPDIFLHLAQQPTLSFDMKYAGGILDADNPAEGKFSLRLDGSLKFPENWWSRDWRIAKPMDQRAMLAWYFNAGRKLVLKPGTRYQLRFQYRCAADEGYLDVRSARLGSYFMGVVEEDAATCFAPKKIKPKAGDHNWQKFSFEFDVPASRSDCLLTFINRSITPVWIDTIELETIGPAKISELVKPKTYFKNFDLAGQLRSTNLKGAWGIYGKEVQEKELNLIRNTTEGIVEMKEFGGRMAAGIKFDKGGLARYYYFRAPDWMQDLSDLDLFIEYFDGSAGRYVLETQYNGELSPFASAPGGGIVLTGDNTWKTIRYRITDANFKHAGNGGDFRIGAVPDGFALGTVAILPADELVTTGVREVKEGTSLPGATKTEAKPQSQPTADLSRKLLSGKLVGAYAVYEKEPIEQGVTLLRTSVEGIVEIKEFGGRMAAGIKFGKLTHGRYYYFNLPDWVKSWPKYEFAVEYFDGGTGEVNLQYDAIENSIKSCPVPIKLTGSNTWKIFTCIVSDPLFKRRLNGCDFRLGSAPDGFALGAVAVLEPGQLEK